MAAVMHRLLEMSISPSIVDDTFRLAMLAFCANAFSPWRHLRMPFGWLQQEHKRAFTRVMESHPDSLDPRLMSWILTIYRIAFSHLSADDFEESQLWLAEASELCGLTSWDGVKKVLGEYLWLDIVCDDPAQKIFNQILPCYSD